MTLSSARHAHHRARSGHGGFRRPAVLASTLAVLAALLTLVGPAPTQAAQATGDDVPVWQDGWSWTYATSFHYVADGTDVTIHEDVTYTVVDTDSTFQGQDAYELDIDGTITGGGGSVSADGTNATLKNFSGSVSGTRHVRRSDLALLREHQQQDLDADAQVSIITVGITAEIDLTLTPDPGWRQYGFPVNPGDSWVNDTDVDYTGGFSYDAGSFGSGSSPFNGTFPLTDPVNASAATINVPIGTVPTTYLHSVSGDGKTENRQWWSAGHANDARQILKLPLGDDELTLDRRLKASSRPAPSTTMSTTITPSLTCAGGDVTVAGEHSSGASGVPVTVSLDRSPVSAGDEVTVTTTTGAGGTYDATLTAPADADGMQKNGVRGSWGVLASTNAGATGAATLVVTPDNCSSLTYTGATSAPQQGTATLRATLADLTGADVSGRTVTFALSGGASVDATTDAAGVAEASITIDGPPRNATVSATFAGGGGLEPAQTSEPFVVGTIPTTTSVVADPPVVTIGDPVAFTATVSGNLGTDDPEGAVQFRVDGSDFAAPVALTDGEATSPDLSTLGLGDHTVTASYAGSTNHGGSTSPAFTFTVREPLTPTSTTSSVAPSTAVFGEQVTLAAEVTADSGTPTGDVTFTSGGDTLGTAALDGTGAASLVVADLAVGSHDVVASYSGDETYDASSAAPRTVTVAKADTEVTLTASDTSTVTGEGVDYQVSVAPIAPGAGTPEGAVQLTVDGTDVGSPVALSGGTATFPTVADLTAGSHTVAVAYDGSATHRAGSDSLQQQVDPADTSTTVIAAPSPSNEGENVTFTASVAAVAPGGGAPTGTVSFTADGNPIGAAPLQASGGGSQATLAVADLAPGSVSVVASYSGSADHNASDSAPISHTVIEGAAVVDTATVLTSAENPSTYGGLISFSAEVTAGEGTPQGAVQFSVDGTAIGGPVPVGPDGVAQSITLASPMPGDHTVVAAFEPDAGWSGSGAMLTQTVQAAPVDLTASSSDEESLVGEAVTFTATVASTIQGTAAPGGHVQFTVDGQPLGDAVEITGGQAVSESVDDLAPGDHEVGVLYSGDVRFASASATLTQSVLGIVTDTTLSATPTSSTYGDSVELVATVTPDTGLLGAPAGTVTFSDGGDVIGTAALSPDGGVGVATLTTSTLGAGDHDITAAYSGSDGFDPSTSDPVTVSVAQQATGIVAEPAVVSILPLGLPLGRLVATLTGGGEPLAGETVEFRVGSNTVCESTTDADGVATCNAAGHLLGLILNGGYVASYAGDANHQSSSARGVILR